MFIVTCITMVVRTQKTQMKNPMYALIEKERES